METTVDDVIKEISSFFIKPEITRCEYSEDVYFTETDPLNRTLIAKWSAYTGNVSFENKACFNKWSQAPMIVNGRWPISKRRRKLIVSALNFLLSSEGERASATFEFPRQFTNI